MAEETYDDIVNWLADLTPASTAFVLRRVRDVTGLSGTGVVADGAIFPDGRAVTRWRGGTTGIAQTCVWDNIQHVRRIHGHDGATRIELVPYGVLAKMVVAAMEAEQDGASVVGAIARELAEHRQDEDALNRAACGEEHPDQPEADQAVTLPPAGLEAPDPAGRLRSLWAQPHGSACICRDCTALDEAERSGGGAR